MSRFFVSRINNDLHSLMGNALEWINWQKRIKPGSHVFIKPNLTYTRYKEGVTTSPEMVETLLVYLKTLTNRITVFETNGGMRSWNAESAFEGHRLPEICNRFGARLINMTNEESEMISVFKNGTPYQIPLPKALLHEADAFITMPVPKIHCMTGVSLGMKNQWGCVLNNMRLLYHHFFTNAILEINKRLNPMVIGDGEYMLDDNGPMDGKPIKMNLLLASDSVRNFEVPTCRIMNVNPKKIPHLAYAIKQGFIEADLKKIEMNSPLENFAQHHFTLKRTPRNWIVLAAFNNYAITKLFYDSGTGRVLHKILYSVAGRPSFEKPD